MKKNDSENEIYGPSVNNMQLQRLNFYIIFIKNCKIKALIATRSSINVINEKNHILQSFNKVMLTDRRKVNTIDLPHILFPLCLIYMHGMKWNFVGGTYMKYINKLKVVSFP
jgi:hypothetical protein